MSAPRLRPGPGATTLVLGLSLLLSARATAQVPATGAGAGIRYESYSYGSPEAAGAESINLLTFPFAARVGITRGLTVDVRGAWARASVAAFGSSFSLSGLTDTEVRATGATQLGSTALALGVVGLVPSGHASLTLEETVVAGVVASDLLPFRVSSWGAGGGAAAEASVVRGMEQGSVGLAASYRVAGSFQPFAAWDALRYRPGAELRLATGLERTLAGDRTLALQLAYSRFGQDRLQDRGWLRSGQRIMALGSYTAPAGNATVSGYGGVLYRSGGALGDFLDAWNLFDVLARFAPPSETLLMAGSSARVPWRTRVLVPALDVRLLRRSDGTGQGMLLGLGGSAELPLGDGGARVVPGARLRIGKLLVSEGVKSGVMGFEVGIGLELGGAR